MQVYDTMVIRETDKMFSATASDCRMIKKHSAPGGRMLDWGLRDSVRV